MVEFFQGDGVALGVEEGVLPGGIGAASLDPLDEVLYRVLFEGVGALDAGGGDGGAAWTFCQFGVGRAGLGVSGGFVARMCCEFGLWRSGFGHYLRVHCLKILLVCSRESGFGRGFGFSEALLPENTANVFFGGVGLDIT